MSRATPVLKTPDGKIVTKLAEAVAPAPGAPEQSEKAASTKAEGAAAQPSPAVLPAGKSERTSNADVVNGSITSGGDGAAEAAAKAAANLGDSKEMAQKPDRVSISGATPAAGPAAAPEDDTAGKAQPAKQDAADTDTDSARERRAARRAEREARLAAKAGKAGPKLRLVTPASEPVADPIPEEQSPAPAIVPEPILPERRESIVSAMRSKLVLTPKVSITKLSFLLAVVLPTLLVGLYYAFIASPQYRSEARFSVRGMEKSTLETLGLSALPGATTQAQDAYIVIDYIHSKQVIKDIREKLNIDLREFFSRPDIDFVYRIDPDMPLDKFIHYWRWMVDADYNSTTSITTFEVTAFTGEDAQKIADAVLAVSTELVNDLSTAAREQLINNAQAEVARTEDRLIAARRAVEDFRDVEQISDPTREAESDQVIIQELEKTLIELKSRRASLLSTVDVNSPSVRVLDRQIASYTTELEQKRKGIGSGQGVGTGTTLSSKLTQYNSLVFEQEFAEKAYATALASLETSQAEARRQDRYFAIAVEPSAPEISLYPLRVINTMLACLAFAIIWLIGYLVVQAVRDHAV